MICSDEIRGNLITDSKCKENKTVIQTADTYF